MDNVIHKSYVASTDSVNAYGFRVLTDGIRTSRFEKNPICLSQHYKVVGRWLGFKKEGGQLVVEGLKFSRNEYAQSVKNDVEDDIITAVSIGVRIIATSKDVDLMLPGQKYETVTECELIEVSLVDIPANGEAVLLKLYDYNEKGELKLLDEKELITKLSLSPMADTTKPATPAAENTNQSATDASAVLLQKLEALEANLAAEKQARESLQLRLTEMQVGKQESTKTQEEKQNAPKKFEELSLEDFTKLSDAERERLADDYLQRSLKI